MTIQALRGVHDILPTEVEKWRRLERAAREVFEVYGYEEIRLPFAVDLDGDGIQEIVVPVNEDEAGRIATRVLGKGLH